MSLFKRIAQQGWIYAGAIAFNRIVPKWLFRCRRYFVYRLKIQTPLLQNPDSELHIGWCETESQIRAVEELTLFRREFSSGPVRAVQVHIDGELKGGFWAATESFDEDELGVRVELEPNQAWLFAALIKRDYRGRGIYSKILQFITSELAADGKTDLLVAVNPNNKSSHRVHKNNAKSFVGSVFAARFFTCSICFSRNIINQKDWFTANRKDRPILLSIPAEND